MKTGVIVFPGSNCDHDAWYTTSALIHQQSEFIWHKDRKDLKDFDLIVVPGGFSYGDYLRTGAIARFAPVMQDVVEFAKFGGTVIGICNGFQILTECGLLPGALLRNHKLKFVCKNICLRVENNTTRFTSKYAGDQVITVPIAHGDGNYVADDDVVKKLEDERRVVFRYCSESGAVGEEFNPNGSRNHIAGIINEHGNILGMMPHPERCADMVLGNDDGLKVFTSILHSVERITALAGTI
ncbi:phosphoribosylformylglycinamidine synthase subunit PurQ [bacterium]|nr:phosphoribosylformylglycinamidine synthase subunit PurQ [bacterium]